MSALRYLLNRIQSSPQSLFWTFALTHLVLWTIIPSLTCANLPLDVIEGYAWGKEWLIGTHKHPPMQAWILETLFIITGHSKWAPYLASQVAVVTAFWAVWQTGRRIAGETYGLIGALILEGVIYYNFTSPEFNPNVLQLPFWALAGWSFHKAVSDNKILDWCLLGLWAAAGMYSKYSTALFLLVLILAIFSHRDGRRRLTGIGPYLSVTIAVVLFLPHLSWLIDNHFIPLEYTDGRLERDTNHYSAALTTTLMVAGQLIALMFAVFLVLSLYDRRQMERSKPSASFDRIFLTFAAFGPFLATFGMSLALGYHIRDMWETPFWNFLGLWIVVFMRPDLMPRDIRRFTMAWIFVFLMGLLLFIANETLAPFVIVKPKRTIFPGKHLSHYISDFWHERFHTPLNYVIGDTWPAGNVAWYAEDRPHVYMNGDKRISPWINQDDFAKSGGVILWCVKCGGMKQAPDSLPEDMRETFPTAEIQQPMTLLRMTYADVPPAIVGWAIIPPRAHP